MSYLLKRDYLLLIDEENLDVVTYSQNEDATPEQIIEETEQGVKQEIISYVAARYDVNKLFPDVLEYIAGETYNLGALVFLEGTAKVNATAYLAGSLIFDDEKDVYRCIADGLGSEIADPLKFKKIGKNKSWYSALVATQDDTDFNDDAIWKAGDTRNALLKRHVINIALYELHSRINPRNIPTFRIERRDDSIKWLKMLQDPRNNVSADDFLPLKVFAEKSGNDIIWNSRPKKSQEY